MKLGILGTAIVTADGTYDVHTVSLGTARKLAQAMELDSAVWFGSTAQILTELLGVPVPVNRQEFEQQPGQTALVFKLNRRAPESVILSRDEIESIGYTFKVMIRIG